MDYVKICVVILLCLFTVSCLKQTNVTSVDLAEAQEEPMTAEERISILEGRIDLLSSELQAYKGGTLDTNANKGGRPNYASNQNSLNSSPDLSSTVHRIVPRPTAVASAKPKASARSSVVKKSKPTPPVSLPSSSLSTPSTNNKATVKAGEANDNALLSLPPETIVAAVTPTMPPDTKPMQATPTAKSGQGATANMTGQVATANMTGQGDTATILATTHSSGNEKTDYKNALDKALAGKFSESIPLFENFLQNFPSGKYAPNAYYWIGECLYAQKRFPEALLSFKNVATRYPKHHKTADALLKAGMTYDLMGDANNAALQYNALLDDFPKSSAAKIVRSWGYVR